MPDASIAQPSGTQPSGIRPSGLVAAQPPLQAVMRDALRGGSGRVVLRVFAVAPHRRRVARALLQEGALAAGGVVVEGCNDDLLLVGAEAGRAARLRQLLDRLLGPGMSQAWSLDREFEAIMNYTTAVESHSLDPGGSAPALIGLDAWLRNLPLARVIRRHVGVLAGPPASGAVPAFLRLSVGRAALHGLLGGLGGDVDILEHASRILAGRLLRAIGDPAQRRDLLGSSLPGPLHLPLPPAPLPPAPIAARANDAAGQDGAGHGGAALVATVGLEAVADPAALAQRRAHLAAQGWSLEVEGLDAAALGFLVPEAIAADWLRLTWSAALATDAATEALRRVDPERLILCGVETQAAMSWAARLGVRRLEGRFAAESMPSGRHQVAAAVLGAAARMGQPANPRASA